MENPYDEFRIKLNDKNSINIKILGEKEDIPVCAEKNTAGLAILNLLKKVNSSSGVDMEIKKKMKIGAGLGSSGASASASVYGLNKLLSLNLSHNEMIEIASKGEIASGGAPHADNVAGALLGGFVFIKSYNPIDVVKIEVWDIPIAIGVIKKAQRTTRHLIPKKFDLNKVKEQLSHCASIVHSILKKDLEGLGRAINTDYISEPVRAKAIPEYREIKKKILDAGSYGCNISGGGSSIFAICEEKRIYDVAEVIKRELDRRGIGEEVIITKASNEGIKEISSNLAGCYGAF